MGEITRLREKQAVRRELRQEMPYFVLSTAVGVAVGGPMGLVVSLALGFAEFVDLDSRYYSA